MALKRSSIYSHKLDEEELVSVAFFTAVEIVRNWKPRKQTWGSYAVLNIRNALWEYARDWKARKRYRGGASLREGFACNHRIVCLGPGCFYEVEEVLTEILGEEDAILFARRYGLCGFRRHKYKELMDIYELPEYTVLYRIKCSTIKLHNWFCPDDKLTVRGYVKRMGA